MADPASTQLRGDADAAQPDPPAVPDPEVMPPEVAELIDSLHGRFFWHAHGVGE